MATSRSSTPPTTPVSKTSMPDVNELMRSSRREGVREDSCKARRAGSGSVGGQEKERQLDNGSHLSHNLEIRSESLQHLAHPELSESLLLGRLASVQTCRARRLVVRVCGHE